MKLISIYLHPFGGCFNKRYTFNKGLTTICGNNEMGKSTIARAIFECLFTSVVLGKKEKARFLAQYLPGTGCDSVSVTLEFEVKEGVYTLKKKWGKTSSVELVLPHGKGSVSDPAAVEEMLAAFLRHNRATWANILFAFQSELSAPVSGLKENPELKRSVEDILRSVVFAQGGISSSFLLKAATEKVNACYRRWDEAIERPEGNRGISNPWKNDKGTILTAWYELETRKAQLRDAVDYERKLDGIVEQSRLLSERIGNLEADVNIKKPVREDALKRQDLEIMIGRMKADLEALRKQQENWNKAEAEIPLLEQQAQIIRDELKVLEEEANTAQIKAQLPSRIKQYQNASTIARRIGELEEFFKNMVVPDSQVLSQLESLSKLVESARMKLEAQALTVEVKAGSPATVGIRDYLRGESEMQVAAGTTERREVKGGVELSLQDVVIKVTAGLEDASELAAQITESSEKISHILTEFAARDIPELIDRRAKEGELSQQRKQLELVLNGIDLKLLHDEITKAEALGSARGASEIKSLIHKKAAQGGGIEEALKSRRQTIEELRSTHQSKEVLNDFLIRKAADLALQVSSLDRLAPLPEGCGSAAEFIAAFDKSEQELREVREAFQENRVSRAELEKEKPELEISELTDLVKAAGRTFEKAKAEGQAAKLILSELTGIMSGFEEQAFAPLQQKVGSYLSRITNNKYAAFELQGGIPSTISGESGALSVEHLSKGTMDALSLAIRLGMAEYYLAGMEGFILLDDPMVDMDRERQQMAAEIIVSFSKRHQVVVFTCHEEHMDLLQESYEPQPAGLCEV